MEIRILSCGLGVDSLYLLLAHVNGDIDLKISRVMFANTGAESQHTIALIRTAKRWCHKANIPFTVVQNQKETLVPFLTRLGSLPLLPGSRKHLCSLKFKAEPLQRATDALYPNDNCTFLIGIGYEEQGRAHRFTKPKGMRYNFEYPLINLQVTRHECNQYLLKHGYDIRKSGCFCCPFLKPEEIKEVVMDPEMFAIVSKIEMRHKQESPRKHQRWIQAGMPKNNAGISPKGMWKENYWQEGARLYAKTVNGKRLSVAEWRDHLA